MVTQIGLSLLGSSDPPGSVFWDSLGLQVTSTALAKTYF